MKIIVGEKTKTIVIVKNNIAIRIAGKVSRYIDASMNRATPTRLVPLVVLAQSSIIIRLIETSFNQALDCALLTIDQ